MFDCNKTEESAEEFKEENMSSDPKTQNFGPNDETMHKISMKKVGHST